MNKELNEKIALFAGFTFSKHGDWLIPNAPKGKYSVEYQVNKPPNFTNSFDAHIRWTIPKLESFAIYLGECTLEAEIDTEKDTYLAQNKSLPLAFALALEKLIDSEGEK